MYIYYLSFNLILSLISLPFYLNNLFTFISNQLLFNKIELKSLEQVFIKLEKVFNFEISNFL